MKVLLLLTRRLDDRRTGRRVVLQTIVDALAAAEHEVVCVCIDKTGTQRGTALQPPGLFRVAWNVLTLFLSGRRSLNECLYYSPTLVKRIKHISDQEGCQLVIADMVRTAQLAEACGQMVSEAVRPPWLVDLDDLLSARYEQMVSMGVPPGMLLGYFAGQIPRWLHKPAAWVAIRMLRAEAKLLRRREVHYAHAADGVSLVSQDEAELLAHRSDREVRWMPMAVAIPTRPVDAVTVRPMSAVFMGGMDYQPNLEAIRWYANEVVPFLNRFEMSDLVLNVLGECPPRVRAELESPNVRFVGYVERVSEELAKHQLFIAPIVSGTGLKTKVLEAMVHGLPVVGTPAAFKGLAVKHDEQVFIASMSIEFAQCLRHVSRHPEKAQQVGLAGREQVCQHFALSVLSDRWNAWVKQVLARKQEKFGDQA